MKQTALRQGNNGKGAEVGPAADTVTILLTVLGSLGARRVLDLGCGDGRIARELAEQGLTVTGIDPCASAVAQAQLTAPQVDFVCSGAEALPPDLIGFDAAFFVNALHHVPADRMADALLSAIAALQDGGSLLVIEPVAQGSFFRAMRPVEDESIIRAQAHRAIEALISSGKIVLHELRRWNRENRFKDLDDFVAYLARNSPERAALAARNESRLARAWRDNIRSHDGMAVLIQPMICWTLTAPGRPVKLGRL